VYPWSGLGRLSVLICTREQKRTQNSQFYWSGLDSSLALIYARRKEREEEKVSHKWCGVGPTNSLVLLSPIRGERERFVPSDTRSEEHQLYRVILGVEDRVLSE